MASETLENGSVKLNEDYLAELQEAAKGRYTEEDEDFMKVFNCPESMPPLQPAEQFNHNRHGGRFRGNRRGGNWQDRRSGNWQDRRSDNWQDRRSNDSHDRRSDNWNDRRSGNYGGGSSGSYRDHREDQGGYGGKRKESYSDRR